MKNKNNIVIKNRLFNKRFFIIMIILINFVFSIDLIKIPYFTDQINHSVYYLNPIIIVLNKDTLINNT